MAYGPNDPATDRRISRLSLISSAANLYAQKGDPADVLSAAQMWESWVYAVQESANGRTITTVPIAPAPVAPGLVCSICGALLTEVSFKKGNTWTPEYLAQQGQAKYATILCKQHYFGKKPATA